MSQSGYYRYLRNLGKPDKNVVLSAAIYTIIDGPLFNNNYGVPCMQIHLVLIGQKIGIRELRQITLKIHERNRGPKCLTKTTTEIQEKTD